MISPVLCMDGIHKSFGSTKVLNGLSLKVDQGDVVAVLGRSGAGKTTLLRVINYLIVPDRGSVTFGETGVEETKEVIRKIRSRIGFVFQGFNLISHMTAAENVSLPLRKVKKMSRSEAMARAQRYLASVGLGDKVSSYPSQLSGGQQQRVGIARALAIEPDLLLFDEPTSALDPSLVGEVTSAIRKLSEQGRTMIVVTHEMGFAREVANRILFLEDGVITCDASPKDFFAATDPSVVSYLSAFATA